MTEQNLNLSQVTSIFDALSNETRLSIFKLLVDNDPNGLRPGQIAQILAIPKNTLSFHLSLLSHLGLVSTNKVGREITIRPICDKINQVMAYLLKNCCSPSIHNTNSENNNKGEYNA